MRPAAHPPRPLRRRRCPAPTRASTRLCTSWAIEQAEALARRLQTRSSPRSTRPTRWAAVQPPATSRCHRRRGAAACRICARCGSANGSAVSSAVAAGTRPRVAGVRPLRALGSRARIRRRRRAANPRRARDRRDRGATSWRDGCGRRPRWRDQRVSGGVVRVRRRVGSGSSRTRASPSCWPERPRRILVTVNDCAHLYDPVVERPAP